MVFAPTLSRVLAVLLIIAAVQTPAQAQFWPMAAMSGAAGTLQGLARTAMVSLYSMRILDMKSELLSQFFSGLDELKQCSTMMQWTAPPLDLTPPPKTFRQRVYSWIIPGYARYLRKKTERLQRELYVPPVRSWPLCVIGTVRSGAAAYFVTSNAIANIIPSAIANVLPFSFVADDAQPAYAGVETRGMKRRLIEGVSRFRPRLLEN